MGVVWLAKDEKLDQEVALKFLPDALSHDVGSINELKRETKRSRTLSHPNIIRVYDIEEDEEMTAISMEFVNGSSLSNRKAWQRNRHFEVKEIAPWVQQLCEALDYAHNVAKVVHRDLKPANVLLDEQDSVRIADFGIAQTITESMSRISRPTSGTLCYMSPQQAMGDLPTWADDIYALGATIFELLAGKPPFYSGDIVAQLIHKKPTLMANRRQELQLEGLPIPDVWEQVVAACLAKSPADRPKSCREIWDRLSGSERRGTGQYPIPRQDYLGKAAVPLPVAFPGSTPAFESQPDQESEAPVASALPGSFRPRLNPTVLPVDETSAEPEDAAPSNDRLWWLILSLLLAACAWGGSIMLGFLDMPSWWLKGNLADSSTNEPMRTNINVPANILTTTNIFETTNIFAPTNIPPQTNIVDSANTPATTNVASPPKNIVVQTNDKPPRVDIPTNAPPPQPPTPPKMQRWEWQILMNEKLNKVARSNPWINSIGMKFVPLKTEPRGNVIYFCIWETRIQDFEAYVGATGVSITNLEAICDAANAEKGLTWKNPGFAQTPQHPVVGVSWEDATHFCAWLTRWEEAGWLLPPNYEYRLPTDLEWSASAGLPAEVGDTPKERDQKIPDRYPWNGEWPPPVDRANYAREEVKNDGRLGYLQNISDYKDGFLFTAPAGFFIANNYGIYDLSGNVWEWCLTPYGRTETPNYVVRGASWADGDKHKLYSSYRQPYAPFRRLGNIGFRCVMAIKSSR
jgi:serine/threonine protein kinase